MSRKILFINGSPRPEKDSCSTKLIQYFSKEVQANDTEIHTANALKLCKKPNIDAHFKEALTADSLMIVAPLYVDNVPSSVLDYMRQFECFIHTHNELITHPLKVYALINCGFLGGYQNYIALEIIEHFAEKAGFIWCGGLGIGSGGMLNATFNIPREAKMQKPIYEGLDALSAALRSGTSLNTPHKQLLVTQDYSPKLFIFSLNMSWIAQSGFKFHGIYNKPYLRH